MNRGLAVSAEMMRLPSLRASSLSGGNCSLLLTIGRLRAGGGTAVFPRAAIHEEAEIRHLVLAQYLGDADQHGDQNLAEMTSDALRPGASRTNGAALWYSAS